MNFAQCLEEGLFRLVFKLYKAHIRLVHGHPATGHMATEALSRFVECHLLCSRRNGLWNLPVGFLVCKNVLRLEIRDMGLFAHERRH